MYSATANKDGYLPTHNIIFAKPPTGSYATDWAHSRSKHFYQDLLSLRCGSHTQESLLQMYERDTGDICHDISVPLYIKVRHWGAVRMAYTAET